MTLMSICSICLQAPAGRPWHAFSKCTVFTGGLGSRRGPSNPDRESSKNRFDYPIVRHHPLFAKQRRDGSRSNFSSLLLGENVRIIRRRGPFDERKNNSGGQYQGGETFFLSF